MTGKPADRLEFTEVRAVEGLRETYVAIGERNLHVGVANGLTNAKILLREGDCRRGSFHVIEVMACPGGCIGGGGQPYPPEGVKVLDPQLLRKRAGPCTQSTAPRRSASPTRTRRSRKSVRRVLGGPGSERAHELCTPITGPDCREESDEHGLTDNWEAGAKRRPQRPWAKHVVAYIDAVPRAAATRKAN